MPGQCSVINMGYTIGIVQYNTAYYGISAWYMVHSDVYGHFTYEFPCQITLLHGRNSLYIPLVVIYTQIIPETYTWKIRLGAFWE